MFAGCYRMFSKVSGTAAGKKRTLISMWAANQAPKKSYDPERADRPQEQEEELLLTQIDEPSEKEGTPGTKTRAQGGAATYRCSFKNEWSHKWPFITKGTLSTQYWCSVCRVENACCHQGIADVARHVNSKCHQEKQKAVQSSSGIQQFSVPLPSAGAMTVQEVKVGYAQWCCGYLVDDKDTILFT